MEQMQIEMSEMGTDEEAIIENSQETKSKIVGRVWINEDVLSGYVVIAPGVTIKFGANIGEYNPAFLYLSKKK